MKKTNNSVLHSKVFETYNHGNRYVNTLEVGQVPEYWGIDFPFVYMPPESLQDSVANKTLDLWSLGCLVLEMYTGVKPWVRVGIDDLVNILLESKAPAIPECLPSDAREFIKKHEDRGSAYELLLHRFLYYREEEEVKKVAPVVSFDIVGEGTRSFPKLRLREIYTSKKKSMEYLEKPIKFKISLSKPKRFNKFLKKLRKMNFMIPMKPILVPV